MLIVHVNVHIKPHLIGPFIEVTLENARLSPLETGIGRFDVLQDKAKPECFVLREVYRSAESAS